MVCYERLEVGQFCWEMATGLARSGGTFRFVDGVRVKIGYRVGSWPGESFAVGFCGWDNNKSNLGRVPLIEDPRGRGRHDTCLSACCGRRGGCCGGNVTGGK